MKIELPDSTAEGLQAMLSRQGQNPDVEAFVRRTMAKRLLFETVGELHQRNQEIPYEQIEADVDAAVKEVREDRKKRGPDADRS